MADKIDMSLDDLIAKTKKTRGGGRGGRGAGRGAGGGRGGRRGSSRGGAGVRPSPNGPSRGGRGRRTSRGEGYTRGNVDGAWSHDLFSGSGGGGRRSGGITTGGPAKLVVSNLDFGVSDSDIQELFSEFGKLKTAAVHYDRSGRSLGTAEIVFDRRSDSLKAMKQYNGVPLDGRAMQIQIATSELNGGGVSSTSPLRRVGGGGGGRVEKPKRGGGGGGAGARSPRGKPARGAGGGRGGRGGRGGGRGKGEKRGPPPSAEELDKELDAYLKAR